MIIVEKSSQIVHLFYLNLSIIKTVSYFLFQPHEEVRCIHLYSQKENTPKHTPQVTGDHSTYGKMFYASLY